MTPGPDQRVAARLLVVLLFTISAARAAHAQAADTPVWSTVAVPSAWNPPAVDQPVAPTAPAVPAGDAATPAPPPLSVTIAPQRDSLTLGTDASTTLAVTASGPMAGQAKPGRTRTTVGQLGDLVPGASPGSFTLEYRVPSERRPQCAIIAVELVLPDGTRSHATTRLMLPAATNFPLRSSPNASVSLEIAGRSFGPVKADADGNVQVPIVVPPDIAVGRARAINEFGIATETEVNLQPRDYPRVLIVAPPDAEAGSTVAVDVWAVAPSGTPSPPEEMDLRASWGRVRRDGGAPGVAHFAVTLPGRIGAATTVELVGSMQDGTSNERDTIAVHVGSPAAFAFSSSLSQLVVGTPAAARLTVSAQDRFGNTASTSGIALTADGAPLATKQLPSAIEAHLPAPAGWPGRDHVTVKATWGRALASSMEIPLTGGDPAHAVVTADRLRIVGDGRSVVDVTVDVRDDRSTPTSAPQMTWDISGAGSWEVLPAPRFGAYAIRFTPRRTPRDQTVVISAIVGPTIIASTRLQVEAEPSLSAAARVGVASNLGSAFSEAAFVEATVPLHRIGSLGRLGRLLSAGISVGYVHGDMTTTPASVFSSLHVDISQAPVLALARLRVPGDLPFEISILATGGVTFASTDISPLQGPFGISHGTARGIVLGGGADASMILDPGELVVGARYLHADLGRTSSGDQVAGNTLGLICDLGFRMGF
jgi:hypothetical protein